MSWHNSAGPAWPVLWPRAAPGLADALRLRASMGWRLPLALRPTSPTSFYPCGLERPSPDALCVFRRQLEGQRRRPHLHDGVLSRPWASIMASATPFFFCTTHKHLTVKREIISMAYTIIPPILPLRLFYTITKYTICITI